MAQIGTIKVETQNNGTVNVPVFNTGDSGSNVYEFVRVQTASGTGFIPVVDPTDASFPYLRVHSQNNGVVAVHNDSSLIQEVTVDSFEDQNLNEWSDETGAWSNFDSNVVKEGTYSIYADSDGGESHSIESSSGLNTYPQRGDTIKIYYRYDADLPDFSFTWAGTPSSGNYYNAQVDADQGGDGTTTFFLDKDGNTQASTTDIEDESNHLNEWMEIRINFGDPTITAEVFDSNETSISQQLSFDDTEYDSGGIGVNLNHSAVNGDLRGWIDYIHVIR